ncbi:FKBP-type peptidyl-prolyl cis-trans isomerase [Falsiporphyromonas endometrii]|uniref:Peptidyl-prolyl cis-trans isomerase n=1 Tax=Falsiporphyromonas endometrii TaxID=1387297 RepID=A0ABV9K7T3_9PORP
MSAVDRNMFVACSYELYAGADAEKELVEKTEDQRPLEFICGMGMMLPAFEKNLTGLKPGDKFDFTLSSDDAYGSYQEEYILTIQKSVFLNEKGEFDSENVYVGNVLPMNDSEGNLLRGQVVEILDDAVKMDFNHPLANMELHFVGEIIEVREATAEDNSKFFASSCGCGCGCGEGDDCGCGGGEECGCGGGSCGCH